MEGKIIEVKRHYSQNDLAQSDPAVKEWLDSAFKGIGSYWDTQAKVAGSGLSWAEKKILMPILHAVESEDRDFRGATENYFNELMTKIPPGGLRLQIGLRDDEEELSADNLPINVKDYVSYKHLMAHPVVAKNENEAAALPYKKFFIHDQEESVNLQEELVELEDKAAELYFTHRHDANKVEQILVLMGIKTRDLNEKEKGLKLKELTRISGRQEETMEAKRIRKFIKVATSKELELEYMITELIGAQVLEKIGTEIVIAETNNSIGNGIREAIIHLKNKKNSKTLLYLKNHFKNLIKENKVGGTISDTDEKVEEEAPAKTTKK